MADRPKLERCTVRWKTRRPSGVCGEDNFIESQTAGLVAEVQQKNVQGLRNQLQALNLRYGDVTNVQDEYAVSLLEHAVRSGSTAVLDILLECCHTEEERNHAIRRAMLFAIKNNNIVICRHALELRNGTATINCNSHDDTGTADGHDEWMSTYPQEGATKSVSRDALNARHPEGQRVADVVALRMRIQHAGAKPSTLTMESQMDESEFSEEMTPIVMAAQLERTEIIRLLIDHCSDKIHPLTEIPANHDHSSCYICQEQVYFVGRQSVEACRKAIEVYKALSSPAYMFQARVRDPILEAFMISHLMERRKAVDPAFMEQYDLIAQKCKRLTLDLLDVCRTRDEVAALLNHKEGIQKMHQSDHTAKFPRLAVAIYYNQKEFIAHHHCQQVIQNIWYKGLPNWVCHQDGHVVRVVMYIFLLNCAMPFILAMYMLRVPCLEKLVRRPLTKFLFDLNTFTTFLALLFVNGSLRETHVLGARLNTLEILVIAWLTGYTMRYFRMLTRRRCFYYTSQGQPRGMVWQGASILFLWTHFALKVALYVVGRIQQSDMAADRLAWSWCNPFLWCEIFYSLACLISVAHLYTFFKASSTLGPLQISLSTMFFDILRFIILFFIIMSAFALALHTLYIGYPNLVQRSGEPARFSSLLVTYKTLFWSLFGHGDPGNVDIWAKNASETSSGTGTQVINVHHPLTEAVGFGLYGAYHMFVIVVLLNMLVAMMANTYNVVAKNCVAEWRVARTQLILMYMNDMGVLVPPFNILPIRFLIGLVTGRVTPCTSHQPDPDSAHKRYEVVMDTISKRYWRQREETLNKHSRQCVCHGTKQL